ncbi:TM2 domain-containing protein 3-like isoform X2 [Aphis gossypii]|nr:TM2 domain-containing protein 3-like isoform X2 [Aphis gossypii]
MYLDFLFIFFFNKDFVADYRIRHDVCMEIKQKLYVKPMWIVWANCTVNRLQNVLSMGRTFLKRLRRNWTGGHQWSTVLMLSIAFGGFGIDRFYLGY